MSLKTNLINMLYQGLGKKECLNILPKIKLYTFEQ